MAIISLQEQIIKQIESIQDVSLLEKIKSILDASKYNLSENQVSLINEADIQYESGDVIDGDAMNQKFDEWRKR